MDEASQTLKGFFTLAMSSPYKPKSIVHKMQPRGDVQTEFGWNTDHSHLIIVRACSGVLVQFCCFFYVPINKNINRNNLVPLSTIKYDFVSKIKTKQSF